MKYIVLSFIIVLSVVICGCALFSRLTPDGMEKASKAIGVATGYVVNHTSMNDKTKISINDILLKVSTVVPSAGETFTSSWTPVVKEYINKFISEERINEQEGTLIESAFLVICDGMDYIFDVKYTEAGKYVDLVNSAINGFCYGFTSVVAPSRVMHASIIDCDIDAYNYLIMMRDDRNNCR